MSSSSTLTENTEAVLQLLVQYNGVSLADTVQISHINITHKLNSMSEAVIRLRKTDAAPVFQAGTDIIILAGWGNNPTQMIYYGDLHSYSTNMSANDTIEYTLYCRQPLFDVRVLSPDLTQPTVLTLTYGETIQSFKGSCSGVKSIVKSCVVSCIGSSVPIPGSMIELVNVGVDFSGPVLVTELSHTIADGYWLSNIITCNTFSDEIKTGKQKGLQAATVKKLTGDPKAKGRILVTIMLEEDQSIDVWAYYAGMYANGVCFYPEIDDEVVVDTLSNDADVYVVLGCLTKTKKYAYADLPDERNNIKSFTTRSHIKIKMDDEEKILSIETPGGNSVVLSDKDKSVCLKDQNNNKLILSNDGITILSDKDITLKTNGNIVFDSVGKTSLISKQDVNIEGANINQTAHIGFTAKGNATAELSASGQTTVKGAIVMIN